MEIEGELYISIDRVKENALTEGIDFWNELYRVVIHGSLHLVGYDDKTNTLRETMKLAEDKYINTICFT
jgi:rRNA maturation RNase YbeY